jgi:hypothetical protein
MPASFMARSSRSSSGLSTAGPNHHQRIMIRLVSGGRLKEARISSNESDDDVWEYSKAAHAIVPASTLNRMVTMLIEFARAGGRGGKKSQGGSLVGRICPTRSR